MPGVDATFTPLSDSDCQASSSSGGAPVALEAALAGAAADNVVKCTSPSSASPAVDTARPAGTDFTSTWPT